MRKGMRKGLKEGLIALVLFTLVVSLFLVVGCGDNNTTTIKTPEGDFTFDTDDEGNVTISSDEGTFSTGSSDKAPTEAELGFSIYPGAKYVEGSGGVTVINSAEGSFKSAFGEWTTTDSLSQVVAFYTGKLGEPTFSTGEETAWYPSMASDTGGATSSVLVAEEIGKVKITITRTATTEK
jgi:hypothetical protein